MSRYVFVAQAHDHRVPIRMFSLCFISYEYKTATRSEYRQPATEVEASIVHHVTALCCRPFDRLFVTLLTAFLP